ncbi:hypothetical protein KOI35_44910 [Actinoplanes bogorensis]|uniref:Uncharacterized protein n=1 Tax=Paractinoplanes bogorensis TaxID=1610840 RepID=A0ABS5Z853_9ACTN|nr:hypothetical protein [Actinoplanes bogorensis]MBU2670665.1 hypothetical protein [Actinoplanes bogorensis]
MDGRSQAHPSGRGVRILLRVTLEPEKPRPRRNPWAPFMRSLTDLATALDVPVPADAQPDRESSWAVERLVLEAIKERRPLAEDLFAPVMNAAIHHPDPSFNARFVFPLVGDFGRRRVRLALIDVMRSGPEADRAGAAYAWYQSYVPMSYLTDGIPEDRRPAGFDQVDDLWEPWDEACLRAFLATDDLRARRAIVAILPARDKVAEHLRDLAAEMIRQVRVGGDSYMNSRIFGEGLPPPW